MNRRGFFGAFLGMAASGAVAPAPKLISTVEVDVGNVVAPLDAGIITLEEARDRLQMLGKLKDASGVFMLDPDSELELKHGEYRP